MPGGFEECGGGGLAVSGLDFEDGGTICIYGDGSLAHYVEFNLGVLDDYALPLYADAALDGFVVWLGAGRECEHQGC